MEPLSGCHTGLLGSAVNPAADSGTGSLAHGCSNLKMSESSGSGKVDEVQIRVQIH